MIGTEFIKGQGLGNQLFCYVTARCIARELECEFGNAGCDRFANNIHNNQGMYFMDIDLGEPISKEDKSNFKRYDEAETRLYISNSKHDMIYGCYVSGADEAILKVEDNTIIYGNMQSELYFDKYRDDIRDWLKVRPEYEIYDYSKDNICIINIRGGEYQGSPELHLRKQYYVDGMRYMKSVRDDMEFVIITDDVESANSMFPDIVAMHNDIAGDYVIIKNARYLLLSNSSFAFFPAYTSDTVKMVVAPKYWARHNVSDGYWASEQNIYKDFLYMDRQGKVYTATECKDELDIYKRESKLYKVKQNKPKGINLRCGLIISWIRYKIYYIRRLCRGILRRAGVDA